MKRFFAFKKMIPLMLALAFAASLAGCTQSIPEIAQPEGAEGSDAAEITQTSGYIEVPYNKMPWMFIGDEIFYDYFERVATPEQKAELEDAEPIEGMPCKMFWQKKSLQILGLIPEELPHLTVEQALAVCEKLDPNDYEGPDSWERAVVTGMDEYAVVPDYEGGSGYTVRHFLIDDVPTGFISVYLGVVTHRDLVNGTEEELYSFNDHLDIQEP